MRYKPFGPKPKRAPRRPARSHWLTLEELESRLPHDARARGKRNPHATRIVARSWIRVIWACWHTNTPYDPLKHTAEQRAATLT